LRLSIYPIVLGIPEGGALQPLLTVGAGLLVVEQAARTKARKRQ